MRLLLRETVDQLGTIGDIVEVEVTPKDFGRIAAQTAKQVIVQRIREAERDMVYRSASSALSASAIRQQFSTPVNIAISQFGVEFLRTLGDRLAELKAVAEELGIPFECYDYRTPEEIHNGVYEVAPRCGTDARHLFELVYLAFLGQARGPRLGWFLEALGREFVLGRLSEAVSPCVL